MNREQAAERLKGLAVPVSAEAAMDMAIEALEQEPYEDKVSLAVFKQVMRERDIAIEQLKEMGYEFGEKIRTDEDAISRQAAIELASGGCHPANIADELRKLPSVIPARPTKGIDYKDCAKAMMKMWMDNVLTDAEYSRIMDKLNVKHKADMRGEENAGSN